MDRRILLVAATVFTLAAEGAAPDRSAPGLTFGIRSDTPGDSVSDASSTTTRVRALGGVLRFDGEDTQQRAGGAGSYVLVNPAAKLLHMVMPDRRQYIEINFADSTGQALGAMASLMAASAVVRDIQVSGSSLGGGGSVGGYATNRYRITTSYTEVQGGDEARPRKVRMLEEFWVANALKDIPDPIEALTRAFGGANGMPQTSGTMSELMRRRADAQRKLFSGLPMRSVVRTTTSEPDGSVRSDTATTEIVDLKKVDLDPATMRLPVGYTRMDMKAFMNVGNQMREALRSAGRRPSSGSNDSTSLTADAAAAAKSEAKQAAGESKEAAKDAAKGAAKDQAKNKAKCALGGMLGKKKC